LAEGTKRVALLAAGGTGGHLFPAEALASELENRGWQIHLATDVRAERYAGQFRAKQMHVIRSATPAGRNPVKLAVALLDLFAGYCQSRKLIKELQPRVVIGFGGYPTLPPLIAAQRAGIANMIHESNAVMGRANRLLARGTDIVAIGLGSGTAGTIVTGNPVRSAVIEASGVEYPVRDKSEPFSLLVFGGSQGAQYFGETMPRAIGLLDEPFRRRLRVVQQVRQEQIASVKDAYAELGIDAQIAPFFDDMPGRIAASHFVVSRAGASTVTELAVIGRPALLVPYPYALDHDQARNAEALERAGGAMLIQQRELSAQKLADILKSAIDDPQRLAKMAEKAKTVANADATTRLADLAEGLAAGSAA
jgi:UDP-N-acetylglucosamine--N-acetylmuramyl-(pentapeptide) pyrophosphoryl-undecaprenol N-acetylglucosamine transferase